MRKTITPNVKFSDKLAQTIGPAATEPAIPYDDDDICRFVVPYSPSDQSLP